MPSETDESIGPHGQPSEAQCPPHDSLRSWRRWIATGLCGQDGSRGFSLQLRLAGPLKFKQAANAVIKALLAVCQFPVLQHGDVGHITLLKGFRHVLVST